MSKIIPVDDPAADKVKQAMRRVAQHLSHVFEGKGYALFVFPLNEFGFMNWLSNVDWDEIRPALMEYIAYRDGRMQRPPNEKQ